MEKIVSYTSKIIHWDNSEFTDAMSIWNKHVETFVCRPLAVHCLPKTSVQRYSFLLNYANV